MTLGYLALQIRQNTKSVRDSVYEASTRASSDYLVQIGVEAEVAEVLLSGSLDFDSLNPKDRMRFHFMLLGILNNYEGLHHHYQRGNVDSDLWDSREARLRGMLQGPGLLGWWSSNRSLFRESFQQLVDEVATTNAQSTEEPRLNPDPFDSGASQ